MSLFTASMGVVAKPAAAGNPSAVVAGAGTSAANGTYTRRTSFGELYLGKPYYTLEGQPDSDPDGDAAYTVFWRATARWTMHDDSGGTYYSSGDDVAFPWLATWEASEGEGDTGSLPAPTVTEG